MQEFQPMVPGGGGGGIFAAVAAAVPAEQRRLRAAAAAGFPAAAMSVAAPVKCPRCESANTKFCYYNNYNLSQPRHFCKSCRRYWTKGGVLRNVPVGGGSRKSSSSNNNNNNKRAASNRPSSAVGSDKTDRSISGAPAAKPQIDPVEQIACGGGFEAVVVGPDTPLLGFGDHGAGIGDLFASKIGGGVHDWPALMDPAAAAFDLAVAADQGCYWNNHSHWDETDPALFIP